MNLLFGVEVETFHLEDIRLDCGPLFQFHQGYDSSIKWPQKGSGQVGDEFRNYEPMVFNEENIEVWCKFLRKIKEGGFRVNGTCGLHFHMSSPEAAPFHGFVIDWANVEIAQLPYLVKQQRKEYCTKLNNSKYMRLRFIAGSRVEFRIFNGSLNIRHFVRSLKFCREFYERMVKMNEKVIN